MIRYKNIGIQANECGGYVLGEIRTRGSESKNPGEEYFVGFCYPSTLKGCFKRILEIEFAEIVNTKELTINQALNELELLQMKFQRILDNNIKEELE